MFCKNCGQPMDEHDNVCPNCGAVQNQTPPVVDNGGIGWGLLGCCIPVVGLVLFLVWKDTKNCESCRYRRISIGHFGGIILYFYLYNCHHLWRSFLTDAKLDVSLASHHLWVSLSK